jgi:hypothetical protein
MRRFLIPHAALVVLIGLAAPASAAADTLNEKVVRFARDHLGEQVGNGECWTLVDGALRFAGAHRPGTRGYGTYVFGRKISAAALTPGDIIQFEGVRLERRTASGLQSWQNLRHHTIIVARVQGSRVTVLHQNYAGSRVVQETTLDLADVVRGSVVYYRPQRR